MATLRELKTRIGSVASTEKITGAMKMISSAKVHQNEQMLRKLQPFKEKIKSIMGHILATDQNFVSPLIEPRDVKRIGIVVYGSDDGLCGAYNVNVLKGFLAEVKKLVELYDKNVEFDIFPVGAKMVKAIQRLRDNRFNVVVTPGVDSKMGGEKVNEFTQSLKQLFVDRNLDLVSVVYMKYLSMSRQVLTCEQLFPVSEKAIAGDVKTDDNQLYIFEPDANSIFNEVLPMFVLSTMQEITIENRSSEQAARVMAMQSANDNAKKLLEELQLEYNKLRQQSITTELLDILGGQVER
jgi:F-type H+-transporting ATPase subunit gamma